MTAPHRPRVGVFASRAPYRPNPIGLSCVKLDQIKGRTLFISEADLLNDTPILDIKPYIPAADAFPHARAGWVEEQTLWRVLTTPLFDVQAAEILSRDHFDLAATARLQLAGEPFDSARKRVRRTSDTTGILCVQYYRISFEVDAPTQTILVTSVTQVSATD